MFDAAKQLHANAPLYALPQQRAWRRRAQDGALP